MFRSDGGDVHSHWLDYTQRMDRMVEEAFRLNVKWSLQELSRAVNGDGKTLPNPLFKVKVVLTDKIEFSPSIEELEGYVSSISGHLIETVSEFKRLPEILTRTKNTRKVSKYYATCFPTMFSCMKYTIALCVSELSTFGFVYLLYVCWQTNLSQLYT